MTKALTNYDKIKIYTAKRMKILHQENVEKKSGIHCRKLAFSR